MKRKNLKILFKNRITDSFVDILGLFLNYLKNCFNFQEEFIDNVLIDLNNEFKNNIRTILKSLLISKNMVNFNPLIENQNHLLYFYFYYFYYFFFYYFFYYHSYHQ
jgi:uncharacterized membrane protein YqiK